MSKLIGRTIFLAIKGLAFILGGLLFGALPLLAIVLWKVLKGGTIAAMWTIGVLSAAALFIVRSV